MSCLVALIALFTPRIAIVLVVLFSDYIGEATQTVLWPLLGFFFLPMTTLAYAWAWHTGDGSIHGIGLIAVVFAVLFDLGLLGIGGQARKRERVRVKVK